MITTDTLKKQLAAAEKALQDNERKLSQLEERKEIDAVVSSRTALEYTENTSTTNPADRLEQLDKQASHLILLNETIQWSKIETHSFVEEAHHCVALADILLHAENHGSDFFDKVYQEEYVPLYQYVKGQLLLRLRRSLKAAAYPSVEGCEALLEEFREPSVSGGGGPLATIAEYCELFQKVKNAHNALVVKLEQGGINTHQQQQQVDEVLLEFCRPFVERIRFHFVEPSKDRPTSTRIDKLPELLLGFLREHCFESGAWDIVSTALASSLRPEFATEFVNEIIRMIEWVFGTRNFFRHSTVAGKDSKPLILLNAIEQLLMFDGYVQTLVPAGQSGRLLSLMDIFVAGDNDLLGWWLERERETTYSILFDTELTVAVNHVSPRAEVFCAIMRSIQIKASVFSFSGPYVNHVAAPLCMQFLDAIHETATDLKGFLSRRKLPTEENLKANILEWMEIINGTHMAEAVLSETLLENVEPSLSGDQDLARFGRSLKRLETVLVDEFATAFVDTLLMERGRLAGYLMRCPFVLGNPKEDVAYEISPDLRESQQLLEVLLRACESMEQELQDCIGDGDMRRLSRFACSSMKDRVLTLLTEKLLEVALDFGGMTPELFLRGCNVFALDIECLFSTYLVPQASLRLLEITKFMVLERNQLAQIRDYVCALSGQPPPLTEEALSEDNRLYEEAVSMLRAKGFVWMELSDALSILNRIRD